ncbi:hypothetical protein TNCV_672941 [Trichonephila clavipes]|nr:hypothetical protein TNCV_672941 [Trichonephila clavipes]
MSSNTRCSGLSRQRGRQVAGRNYPPTNKNTLIRALTEEWDKLPQQLLDNVVQSILLNVTRSIVQKFVFAYVKKFCLLLNRKNDEILLPPPQSCIEITTVRDLYAYLEAKKLRYVRAKFHNESLNKKRMLYELKEKPFHFDFC